MWQPDGWGWRARVGVLTPHADIGPESEFRAMAPDGVSIHAARVPLGAYTPGGAIERPIAGDAARAFAEPPLVDDATELLAAAPLQAIAYCFTSSSYVRGAADDALLQARLEVRARNIPVVITCASATLALRALDVQRLALVNPPWFSAELSERGAEYFRAQGFEVVLGRRAELPADQDAIKPQELYDWIRAHMPKSAEAVFIGGNGFRAVGVIGALEHDLGRPVLTANQVAFWHALNTRVPVTNYGQIFSRAVPGGVNGGAVSS